MVMNDIHNTDSLNQMSNNVVDVMNAIAKNQGIRALLYLNDEEPFHPSLRSKIPSAKDIVSPSSTSKRISPVSFNPNAQVEDRSEIRVYYNIGRFDGSGKHVDYNMHIDIICAKELWMIRDSVKGKSLIRPYEIMSRIFDEIGIRNEENNHIGRPVQFQMLSVNPKFDAIRIYYNTADIMGNRSPIAVKKHD